ncbi:hypothetical protein [Moritella sp. F3]|uniref:hypothetical protein n=1 Tax=Moritella sp. F3 TaxID=2718882 RepID=UPI0018E18F4C|nr:hypothetical protein [Moritella sp. F3]GIC77029.1 hypothetical protein FMO001_17560 [Moritella sp. F1]GIC82148.1 hypothetical protein FMO003_24290 [Moritella sp. F3]
MMKYNRKLFEAVKSGKHDSSLHFISADVRSYETKGKMFYGLYLDSASSLLALIVPVLLIAIFLGAAWGLVFGQNFDAQMFAITFLLFGCEAVIRFFVLYWACNIESTIAHENGQNIFGG